ncbi:DHRS7C isoform 1 [Pan troglodytes]|uniref:Dehydrogenase/reductase SDR family member 7C n=4 Tax=Homininae TaxID=207598 RepID=DRS7C_HUMAN|nr:dehydrogenase/reductase SDR family member 7C isoform 1 precursor [Homo sapiens]XP_511842.4 dehydrogenase/reductase SDR family member 7C isoform X1 [Pan troglodytes]A6NNS2.3 RecName: Full=Dehydrogenase/reductase SDR family member 7C; AltName: Full=Sarcoplasmic reticulum protein of 35 kDa; Short=Protein SRP-35; AltName: Full=Short-chain dehydrogenase/reductase family 32C member 2; Short=Protein SDR32C2; Flags: Precursor [Homo sapiens]AAI71909.1 DHRS7C protein [Homo sapiens]KAI2581382.1 dehydro|eukprot:NP_001207422.1 dehydrogenase/reductase SDR family member 7C isoform 1 precursor [Homo sapiens]
MGVMAMLMLPLLLLGISGLLFIYQEVSRLWSKSAVQNKVVVITDAISGLGKECARVFHTGGARLVLCGKNWERLENLYDALISVADPSKQTFTPKLVLLDLSDISCVPDVAKEVLDCYGCVDILINNASVKVKGPAHKISLELDKKIMDANYFGPITLTKALLPNMISRRTGQIVLVNNIQGKFGIPFRTTYAASKHAALGFFDCLRAEVEEYDVVISTVSPTFIRSYHVYPEQGNWEASIWKFFFRKLTYGVHPVEVAEEVMRTVRRKKQEVFMANPIPKAAVYVRTFFPEFFFAVVACGVKEKLNVPEEG